MKTFRWRLKTVLIGLALTPVTAWATNGYFTHGASTAEKALAGAGVAYSQDSLAASNNPAGMAWQGGRYDAGVGLFMPMRSYSAVGGPSASAGDPCGVNCPFSIGDGDQSIDSENELFAIPSFGYNRELGSDSSIGISIYGNGGMNTEYKGGVAFAGPTGTQAQFDGTYGAGTAGVDLSQLFISTTYARRIGNSTSLGISGIVAYQRFEAKGIASLGGYSLDPANMSNNGYNTSTGIGVRVGFQTLVSPGVRIGAAYQPQIDMSEFDDYAGLFADEGDFDIPSNLTLGIAVNVGQDGVLMLDLQQINYEDVAAIANPIANLVPANGMCTPQGPGLPAVGDGCLGGSDGAGFGWENMRVVKLGYQWRDDRWLWRLGVSSASQPIPSDQALFNILAPGVVEQHLTFGFTRDIDASSSFHFASMYAPSGSVNGPNTFDPAQDIELEMDQYEFVFSYSRRL